MLLKVADIDSNNDRLIILKVWKRIGHHQRAAATVDTQDFAGWYYQTIDSQAAKPYRQRFRFREVFHGQFRQRQYRARPS